MNLAFRSLGARLARVELPSALLVLLVTTLLVAIFAFRDLPLVDLPQHAAQIAVWLHWDDPAYRTEELELNFRTPYLLAYVLARPISALIGPILALKAVVALAVVGHAVAFHVLVRRLGHDPWLAVLGVPAALGYSFCFGFVSFIIALPLAFLAFAVSVEHAERPSIRQGALLLVLLCLTFFAHGIALALTLLVIVPLLAAGSGPILWRLLPLSGPALLGALWLGPGDSAKRIGITYWELGFERFIDLPAMLVSIGSTDSGGTVAAFLLLGTTALLFGAPAGWARVTPLVLALAGYSLFPALFRGVGPLSPRFTVLILPCLLLAFRPASRTSWQRTVGRTGLGLVSVAWIGLFVGRLPAYNQETKGVHAVVDALPPGLDVRPIVFERASLAFPGVPALLHLPAYYLVEKGGTQGYSFAIYPISVVRRRPGVPARMDGGAEWRPEAFDPARELDSYDCFLVHSVGDRSMALFGDFASEVELVVRDGNWWGYQRVGSRTVSNP